MRPHRSRHRLLACAAVAAGLGVSSAGAQAAPPPPTVTPSPGPSASATRTFTWPAMAPSVAGPVTYEVAVTTTAAQPIMGQSVSGTSAQLSLPEGDAWFHVRSVEPAAVPSHSDWSTFGPYRTDLTDPVIAVQQTPAANPRGWVNAAATVTFLCTDANLATCSDPVTFGEGAGQVATGTATDAVGRSATATATVNVDLTAPAPAQPAAPGAGAVVTSTRPEFRWAPASDPLSGLQYYEVWVEGRGKVGSTWATRTSLVSSQTLPAGPVRWYVRAVDNANNAVASEVVAFTLNPDRPQQPADPPPGQPARTITDSGTPAPPLVRRPAGTRAPRPALLRARALRPAAGRTVRTLRPTLRWLRRHRMARLYNVQVYELRRGRVRKVLTAFPRRNAYRVPKGKLRAGRRYVWRVWPYLGTKGYAKAPVGVSYFDVRAPRRRQAEITLSARQLRINQRISQAAVRRVNELAAHLDGRPAPASAGASATPGRVRLAARQLLINQRISQAAVRRVNTVRARLEGRPMPKRAAAAATRGPVRLSVRQLRINQRIAQAPVRRIRAIRRELGLD
ncbi:hypothetical protein [Miltoncostaea marina]|uniref:hypothetical protein n=1 Tax=Miltoncostaea marina TaxID=2843215 RepID=UPI001C3C2D3B|nr:hypothetical protein [Miltoncostaea marina]